MALPTVNDASVMDEDDFFSSKPSDPLTLLVRQDLGPLSVDELQERIEALGEKSPGSSSIWPTPRATETRPMSCSKE